MIWKLIKIQKPWWVQLLALIGFLVMFYFGFRVVNMAVAVLVSMYLHECGHAVVFTLNKIKVNVLLLFPLGAVAAPADQAEDERSDKFPWWNMAWLVQAGLLVNVALMFLGTLLANVPEMSHFGQSLVLVNIYLAVFNLIPLGNLDAGQLFRLLLASSKEKADLILLAISTFLVFGLTIPIVFDPDWRLFLVNTLTNAGWIGFLLVALIGIWRKHAKDDPTLHLSGQAMTATQVRIQYGIYLGLCAATIAFMVLR